jgi:hypothetical protein
MLETMIMMKKPMSLLGIVQHIKINSFLQKHNKNRLKSNYKMIFNKIKSINKVKKINMNKICKEEL